MTTEHLSDFGLLKPILNYQSVDDPGFFEFNRTAGDPIEVEDRGFGALLIRCKESTDELVTVAKYIASVPTDSTYLTATALAKALGCRPSTIKAHLRAGRIPAINISTNAKPNYRFCLESVKAALAAKPATKSTRKQAPTKPFLV